MTIEDSNTQSVEQLTARIKKLESTVYDLDALSQDGFNRIEAEARLMSKVMGASDTVSQDNDDFIVMLEAITHTALDIRNCINTNAELVGCNYRSKEMEKRLAKGLAKNLEALS